METWFKPKMLLRDDEQKVVAGTVGELRKDGFPFVHDLRMAA